MVATPVPRPQEPAMRLGPASALGAMAGLALLASCASAQLGGWGAPTGARYALDGTSRSASSECDPSVMVRYRSRTLRTSSGVRVHPAFAERIPELDRVAREVAVEFYGRPPRRMLTVGGYNCRSIRGRSDRISEHALGNALDVSGFDFAGLRRRDDAPDDLPRRLRRGFSVTVGHDWVRAGEVGAYHGRFLRTLVARLVREDVFRVIYGPAHPGHTGHFHFDMSPFRWIHV